MFILAFLVVGMALMALPFLLGLAVSLVGAAIVAIMMIPAGVVE